MIRGQWPGASGHLKPVHSPGAPAGVLLVWPKLLVTSTDSDHGVCFKLKVSAQSQCCDKVTVQVDVLPVLAAGQHLELAVLLKEANPRSGKRLNVYVLLLPLKGQFPGFACVGFTVHPLLWLLCCFESP